MKRRDVILCVLTVAVLAFAAGEVAVMAGPGWGVVILSAAGAGFFAGRATMRKGA